MRIRLVQIWVQSARKSGLHACQASRYHEKPLRHRSRAGREPKLSLTS